MFYYSVRLKSKLFTKPWLYLVMDSTVTLRSTYIMYVDIVHTIDMIVGAAVHIGNCTSCQTRWVIFMYRKVKSRRRQLPDLPPLQLCVSSFKHIWVFLNLCAWNLPWANMLEEIVVGIPAHMRKAIQLCLWSSQSAVLPYSLTGEGELCPAVKRAWILEKVITVVSGMFALAN